DSPRRCAAHDSADLAGRPSRPRPAFRGSAPVAILVRHSGGRQSCRTPARGGFVSNPVPQTDAVFLKHFAQLIGGLVVLAGLLIAISAYVYGKLPAHTHGGADRVDRSLAPVGAVHAGETGRAAI